MIAICLGTRPEIIKLVSVIKELSKRNYPYIIIHTNQHYDPELNQIFFSEFNVTSPTHSIQINNVHPIEQTASAIEEIGKVLRKVTPSLVIAQGDTNTTQAAALAASKLHIPIAHVEAGLRSYDTRMPEEWNRRVCDHLSTILFAPTEIQKKILLKEGIDERKIHVVGNTIADALKMMDTKKKGHTNGQYGVEAQKYILATIHRQENVDKRDIMVKFIQAFNKVALETNRQVLLPIHPRTKNRLVEFGLRLPKTITSMRPLGYLDFIALQKDAALIMTDSGGVQEEACILRVPCVTLRDTTERPETVEVGANMVAGTDPQHILEAAKIMCNRKKIWGHPFGDGDAGKQIVNICINYLGREA
jgi:UDP-N-acetylglucosamine 2-epimerase (non-hydrolysing)